MEFKEGIVLPCNAFQSGFWIKIIVRCFEVRKIPEATHFYSNPYYRT